MSQHPLNLALRFLLEVGAIVALGMWGWTLATGPVRVLFALLLPALAAALWTQLSYAGDPVHDGARFAVPTQVRLALELIIFVGGWAAFREVSPAVAPGFGVALIVHHLLSWDRVMGMLRGRGS